MNHQSSRQQSEERQEEPPPFWEWLVAGLGAVLLLATIAYLFQQASAGDSAQPVPSVQVVSVDRQAANHLVRVRVRNEGRATAANLRVVGILTQEGREVERSETEFQYLPAHSSREGGLFFTHDPGAFRLEVRPQSYQQP
jgi:uncharacterized protein (TIGR02588 family)